MTPLHLGPSRAHFNNTRCFLHTRLSLIPSYLPASRTSSEASRMC